MACTVVVGGFFGDEGKGKIISNTIKKIIKNLNDDQRKKILIMIPNNAKNHLKI